MLKSKHVIVGFRQHFILSLLKFCIVGFCPLHIVGYWTVGFDQTKSYSEYCALRVCPLNRQTWLPTEPTTRPDTPSLTAQ